MNLAYWCILVAAILPYVWVGIAKSSGDKGRYDNRDPRGWLARQDSPRTRRANGAQLNAYEAFAPFAASVLMAQAAGVDADRIAALAVAFVVLRVVHGVCYLVNAAALRSLVWFMALACMLALMVQAALHVA